MITRTKQAKMAMLFRVTLEIGNIGLEFCAVVLLFFMDCKVGMNLVIKCAYMIGSSMILGAYA